MTIAERLKPYRIDAPFKLFSQESQRRCRDQFEGTTQAVMPGISQLLDERYRK